MSNLAGIVILMRHGDRTSFYQNPSTYTGSKTNLTVLGQQELMKNGQDLRSTYLTGSKAISGIATTLAQDAQLSIVADGAGEGEVIIDSAYSMLQGLYPPATDTITLANGTQISWNGSQPIRVETVDGNSAWTLDGFTSCNTFNTRLNDWYSSSEFKEQAAIANPFFQSLSSVLGDRPPTLQNAWNLFDFLNVESIHNQTIASQVSTAQLENARYWANYHEAGSFSDADPNNIGNIAGQAILPTLMSNINQVANATNPIKISVTTISYKPFMSLFKMWNVPAPYVNNIVDYGSTMIMEIGTDNTMNVVFRNGTDGEFSSLPLMGQSGSMSISSFAKSMQAYEVGTLSSWCDKCQTDNANGCDTLALYNGTGGAGYAGITSTNGHHHVSPVVAGVIGAMVTLAVVILFLLLALIGRSIFGRKRKSSAAQRFSQDRHNSIDGTQAGSVSGSEKRGEHQV